MRHGFPWSLPVALGCMANAGCGGERGFPEAPFSASQVVHEGEPVPVETPAPEVRIIGLKSPRPVGRPLRLTVGVTRPGGVSKPQGLYVAVTQGKRTISTATPDSVELASSSELLYDFALTIGQPGKYRVRAWADYSVIIKRRSPDVPAESSNTRVESPALDLELVP